jgi:hypothetical protein
MDKVQENTAELVRQQMSVGICKFSYTKTDGTERIAYGTLYQKLIPKYKEDKVTLLIEARLHLSQIWSNLSQNEKSVSQNLRQINAPDLEVAEEHFNLTLEPFLPREKRPFVPNDEWCNYYDLEAQDFRKFKFAQLKTIY